MPDQLVVLIGSDGKRATVSRSAATQASMVLRDLLDGREPTTPILGNISNTLRDVAETHGRETGSEHNSDKNSANGAGDAGGTPTIELPFPYFTGDLLQRICAHMTYRYNYQPPKKSADSFSGGNSDGAVGSDGCALVGLPGRNMMREIPRPMVLPLMEYLDSYDRRFIEDWDEVTTVLMVKASTLLNYEELLNLASAKLAGYLSEKSIESLCAFLGVERDFTPEEEAALRKEHPRMYD